MGKIYFVSFYFSGRLVNQSEGWSSIQNEIISEHPLLWEKDKNFKYDKQVGIERLTRVRVIWWKELTNEEIRELGI